MNYVKKQYPFKMTFRIKNENINLARVVSAVLVEPNVNSKVPYVTSVGKGDTGMYV